MIKGRALAAHSLIGKRFKESYDRNFIERTKARPFKIGIHVRGGEVTAVAVEVDHLAERGLTAVHKERTSQFDVAQADVMPASAGQLLNHRAAVVQNVGNRGISKLSAVVAIGAAAFTFKSIQAELLKRSRAER